MESDGRADTLATYLESVQWVKRDADLTETTRLKDTLAVCIDDFSYLELKRAANHLKDGKACGPDELLVEFWKAIVNCNSHTLAAKCLLDFCNDCWRNKRIPYAWQLQNVSMLYKKRDPAD